ncbi:putative MFS general substrate transporter [Seiridium unicorne]|uniref:MFS general substrate transporter n=1 Tax=Seiridium unicorne TaxID=138068 RepID=A0ABR2VJF1_9PEZI
MVSLSPPESQYVWNHGNDDVTEYEGNWHSEGRQGQHQPEHDHDYLGVDINFSTSAPGTDVDNSHIVTGLLTEQPSMNDLMSINHVVGDADIDQNGLLLRGSMPALPCYPGTKTRLVEGVRAASLSTNMTSLNIWALYHYYAPPQLFAAFGTLMGCAVLFMATISFYRWLVLRENKRLDSGEPSEIAKVVKGGVTDEWYSWAGDMRCTAQERP